MRIPIERQTAVIEEMTMDEYGRWTDLCDRINGLQDMDIEVVSELLIELSDLIDAVLARI